MEKTHVKTDIDTLHQDVAELKSDLAELAKAAREEVRRKTVEYDRDHPLAALGIAAGVGFVFGLLVRRRRG